MFDRILRCLVPFVLVGCTSTSHTLDSDGGLLDADIEVRNAHLTAACAPDGGLAVDIRMFLPPGRCSGRACAPVCGASFGGITVEVLVYDGASTVLPIVAPVTIVSSAAAANGVVTVCQGDGTPCETSSDFTLRVDSRSTDLTHARLDYGTRGGFATIDATECPGSTTCR